MSLQFRHVGATIGEWTVLIHITMRPALAPGDAPLVDKSILVDLTSTAFVAAQQQTSSIDVEALKDDVVGDHGARLFA